MQWMLTSSYPSLILSHVIASRRAPIWDSEHVDGFQVTVTAENGQRKVQGPETGMPSWLVIIVRLFITQWLKAS